MISKTFKRKRKWYDDDWDVRDNQRRINKTKKDRQNRKKDDHENSDEELHDLWLNSKMKPRHRNGH